MLPIVIPTLKRLHKQLTFYSIPESYRKNITLVVQPQEEEKAKSMFDNVFVLSGDNIGMAKTKYELAYEWIVNRKENFWYMDDDLKFFYNYYSDDKLKKKTLDEETFYQMITETENWLSNGIVHGSSGTVWTMPEQNYPWTSNSRMNGNCFFSAKILGEIWNDIDWFACCGAEDFSVNLQLLIKGYENRVWYKYVSDPAQYQDGGCATYRNIEYHNNSMRELQAKFPAFVVLREKFVKSGPWRDKSKLAATISWKKAYESSQRNTLDNFL